MLNARERLVEEWDRYHELFSWAPLGYTRLTFTGLICEMNYTGADLLEVSTDAIAGQPLVNYVARHDRARFVSHLAGARESSETVEDELELRSAGGHCFPVRLCTRRSPRRDQGMCWTIFADLTEHRRLTAERQQADDARRQAQEAQRLARLDNEAKDRFVAALSHELRTPLTPVLMATSMLSSLEGLPSTAAAIIGTIRRNVEQEARLIDNLLDVTQLTRHTMLFDRRDVDIHEVLRDAIAASAPEVRAKGLEISLDATARKTRVTADPVRLGQAFQHLLTNAVKYTETGRIVITTDNSEPAAVRVAVADTGTGLSPEGLRALFVPLEPRAARRTDSGLGLGLTICKGIVEAHRGRIAATSPGPGAGTTVEVHLPLAQSAEEARPVDGARAAAAQGPGVERVGPLRILVVEDHGDSGAMLDLLLSSRGHRVSLANSVATALARKDEGWDVVISDLGLPDGSGLEVGRGMCLLARRPRLIALSGYGRPSDIAASLQAGFDVHLVKPLEPDRLFEILDSAL